jgi:hypothetical protein
VVSLCSGDERFGGPLRRRPVLRLRASRCRGDRIPLVWLACVLETPGDRRTLLVKSALFAVLPSVIQEAALRFSGHRDEHRRCEHRVVISLLHFSPTTESTPQWLVVEPPWFWCSGVVRGAKRLRTLPARASFRREAHPRVDCPSVHRPRAANRDGRPEGRASCFGV